MAMQRSRCRSCRAEIVWATTGAGKAMPVDAEPVDDGNVLLDEDDGYLFATVVSPGQIPLDGSPLYASHFASCPNSSQHRKRQ
jgi:hypothetical protein